MPGELFAAPAPTWIRGLGSSIVAIDVVGMVATVLAAQGTPGPLALTLVILAVGALVGAALVVCRITVRVADDAVTFAFRPLYRAVVDVADLECVELVDRVNPASLGGVGLRRMPGRVTGMLWRPAAGVEVRTVRGARFVVVVPTARELYDALSGARARHARRVARD